MSKTAKGLLITAFCLLALWAGLSTLYTYSVSKELALLRREGRSDIVYLRCRIRDLEGELTTRQEDRLPATAPVEDGSADSFTGEEITEAADSTEEATEDVTIPTHNSPETTPSAGVESSPETPVAAPYLVAAHEGVIGLLDATGSLLRTVNVYIMTLPAADRTALEVGIPAESWAEALRILEMYE